MVRTLEELATPARRAYANRLLVLVSSPLVEHGSDSRLRPVSPVLAHQELRALYNALQAGERDIQFHIQLGIASTRHLRRVFTDKTPPIFIHFIGHGLSRDDGPRLVLEDDAGLATEIGVVDLDLMVRSAPQPCCQLAVLNACHSVGLADALIANGVSHVVAISAPDRVLDAAARVFSEQFYPALLSGWRVSNAYQHARDAVLAGDWLPHGVREHDVSVPWEQQLRFRLLPDGSDHHQSIVFEEVAGKPILSPWRDTNLPRVKATPFVGRDLEMHLIAKTMRESAAECIAIHGLPGIGKSELAEACGRWFHERRQFTDGVWLIPLRGMKSAAQALEQIGLTLGIPSKSLATLGALREHIADWQILLILDDADSLLGGDPAGLADLLNALLGCWRLKLIVTSHQQLPGAVFHEFKALRRLNTGAALRAFELYAPEPSEWRAGPSLQDDLTSVLEFLDGYPFPIRLAGTYMKQTRCSLKELRGRLIASPQRALGSLGEEQRQAGSLLGTLELSFEVLPTTARDMFTRLALFPAGITTQTAEKVFGPAAIEALELLFQFSMAEEMDVSTNRRFGLPEPARAFAARKEDPLILLRAYGSQLLKHYHEFVTAIATGSLVAPDEEGEWQRIVPEHRNIIALIDWGCDNEQCDSISRTARLAAAMSRHWSLSGSLVPVALAFTERALQAALRCSDRFAEAETLRGLGDLFRAQQDWRSARTAYRKALRRYHFDDRSERSRIAAVQQRIGVADTGLENWRGASARFRTAALLFESLQELSDAGEAWESLGSAALRIARPIEAAQAFETATATYDRMGAWSLSARCSLRLGAVREQMGDWGNAIRAFGEAANVFRRLGDHHQAVEALVCSSRVYVATASPAAALDALTTALRLAEESKDQRSAATVNVALGKLALMQSQREAARQRFARAAELLRRLGDETEAGKIDETYLKHPE